MPTTRLQQVAQLVKTARVERGLTQAELAEKVGVHTQTIGNLERASHRSEPELLSKLEEVLEVDLSAVGIAAQSMLDMVCATLSLRMRDVGDAKALVLAAETLDFVNEWADAQLRSQNGRPE